MASGQSQAGTGTTKRQMKVKYNKISLNDLEFEKGDKFFERGQFGDVKRAKWNNQEVAVKCFIQPHRKGGFYEELMNLSILQNHSAIVRMHGACVTEHPFIVLEFAPLSLEKVIHECKKEYHYTGDHVIQWSYQAAVGLDYIHEKKILHRDIKPSNALLFDNGRVLKLCDFGTAKKLEHTLTNAVGTIRYMAPEVIRGRYYTDRCDVFSFGMMVWEMLARRRPMILGSNKADNNMAILYAMAMGKRPPKLSNLPRAVSEMIDHCWDEEPHKRPTMSEIKFKLEHLSKFVQMGKPLVIRRKRPHVATGDGKGDGSQHLQVERNAGEALSEDSSSQPSSQALSEQSLSVGQGSSGDQGVSPGGQGPSGGSGGKDFSDAPAPSLMDEPSTEPATLTTMDTQPATTTTATAAVQPEVPPRRSGQPPTKLGLQPPHGHSHGPLGEQPGSPYLKTSSPGAGGQSAYPPSHQQAAPISPKQPIPARTVQPVVSSTNMQNVTSNLSAVKLDNHPPQPNAGAPPSDYPAYSETIPHRYRAATGPISMEQKRSPELFSKQFSVPPSKDHFPPAHGYPPPGPHPGYSYSSSTMPAQQQQDWQRQWGQQQQPPVSYAPQDLPGGQQPEWVMKKQTSFVSRFPRAAENSHYFIKGLDPDLQPILPSEGNQASMDLYSQYKLLAEEILLAATEQNKLKEEAANLEKEIREDSHRLEVKDSVMRDYNDKAKMKDQLMNQLASLKANYDRLRSVNSN